MKVYRLETIDPQILADLLQQLGDLEPGTVLKVDKKKKSIIAWATLSDHLTISTLVERLDQSARSFEVIPLRRLDAEYVAGTISGLMGITNEEETKNPRSRYDYFYGFGMQQQQDEPKERGFRVEADLENNRLLVYANPVEMEEIRHLLQKLGELPDPQAVDDGVRVFELSPDDAPEDIQRRLKKLWRRDNALEFDEPQYKKKSGSNKASGSDSPADTSTAPSDSGPENDAKKAPETPGDATTSAEPETFDQLFAAATQRSVNELREKSEDVIAVADDQSENSHVPSEGTDESEPFEKQSAVQNQPAPVRLAITNDGSLIATSDDPEALAELEDIL
ncbi:MAG: secretin N-terminal domain-containing protein, partial [Planctomyces sp.]